MTTMTLAAETGTTEFAFTLFRVNEGTFLA